MAEEKVVNGLVIFGLTRDEAEMYLFLLRAGASSAGTVERRMRVNRMRIYRLLRSLQEKGLVEMSLGRPTEFTALPLEHLLNDHLEKQKHLVAILEKSMDEIIDQYKKLQRIEDSPRKPRFRVLQGREQVYDSLNQMWERATVGVCLQTTASDLRRLSSAGIDYELRLLQKKRVSVQVVTYVDSSSAQAIKNLLDFVELRCANHPIRGRLCIVDGREVFTTFAMDESQNLAAMADVGLWTDARDYVRSMDDFFLSCWERALPAGDVPTGYGANQMLSDPGTL
jgi:sugar-specific transcriptional regulator TrmB